MHLIFSLEWYVGVEEAPKWGIKTPQDDISCGKLVEINFCPFCAKKLPKLILNEQIKEPVCSCSDGGYYCNTCDQRLIACTCLPRECKWRCENE